MKDLNEFLATTELNEFKRIEDLDSIKVSEMKIETKEATKKDGEVFTYYAMTVDEKEIRIPKTVLMQLKTQKEQKEFDAFKVVKDGDGLNTKYTVITL